MTGVVLPSVFSNMWTVLYIAPFLCVALAVPSQLEWWQRAIFYQVYHRSFQDWDGDGLGDLRGLIHKVDYLKTLGADALCLSPIFPATSTPRGHAVSNFMDVDPVLGTLKDFRELMLTAKYFDLKVILDLEPNHSSDQHEWFRKSLRGIHPYRDYYVWHEGRLDQSGHREPPNNWEALDGGGPAWTWREERQQYYLHQFHCSQPDLNYNNPSLVQEMKDVLRFWLSLGVDGFRVSSAANLFEEPLGVVPSFERTPRKHLAESHGILKQWRTLLEEHSADTGEAKVLFVETHGTLQEVMNYYGTRRQPAAHLVVNSKLITELNRTSSAYDFARVLKDYLSRTDSLHYPNWMLGYQDSHRVASRFGPHLVDAMNMLSLTLPGPSFTYYGEEIGMQDALVSPDPQDVGRSPFQWDNTISAGFSFRDDTWLPVNEDYHDINVEAQVGEWNSHWRTYQLSSLLRHTPAGQRGDCRVEAFSDNVFTVVRSLDGNDTYVFVVNLGHDIEMIELSTKFYSMPQMLEVMVDCSFCPYDLGTILPADALLVLPTQSMILGTTGREDKPLLYQYVKSRKMDFEASRALV